ncbi:MAG: hypothetical protein ACI8RZ_000195 [Myxococcota bacterium]|jgi:hypothetical protein
MLLLLACFTRTDPPTEHASTHPDANSRPQLSKMMMLTGDLKAQLCDLPCSGPFTDLQIWRDGDAGPLALITHTGDLEACSHPPTTWLDTRGEVRLVQESRPVGPAEAEALAEERSALTTGLIKAERLSCD